mmetsp:Transcript_22905/g.49544  ORF Transcript_22905/g.49544 Transcript_22905/m.49544 type:complete len:192 (-) Transcript_22905:235-810(-)
MRYLPSLHQGLLQHYGVITSGLPHIDDIKGKHVSSIKCNIGILIAKKRKINVNEDVGRKSNSKAVTPNLPRKRNYGNDVIMRNAVKEWDSIIDKKAFGAPTMPEFFRNRGIPYSIFHKHAKDDDKGKRRARNPSGRLSLISKDIAAKLCEKYASFFVSGAVVKDIMTATSLNKEDQARNCVNRTFKKQIKE